MIGALVAVCGMAMLVVFDADGQSRTSSELNAPLGDGLCLLSSFFYALSNVLCEKLVRPPTDEILGSDGISAPPHLRIVEYLCLMSCAAVIMGFVQFMILEYSAVTSAPQWSGADVAYLIGFAVTMVVVYVGMPTLFHIASATFANLSLLTADVYAIVWNIALFSILPKYLFFVAYITMVIGLVVYDTKGFSGWRRVGYTEAPRDISSPSADT